MHAHGSRQRLVEQEQDQMTTTRRAQVLSQRPLGLIFDIDGTLSPIAPTPDMARLHPEVAPLLARARDQAQVHVVILSGRAVEKGAALVNVPGLTYIGMHGLEWSDDIPTATSVRLAAEITRYIEPGARLLDLASRELTDLPGVLVERKRVGGTIHYRLSPEPETTRTRILQLLQAPAHRLNMRLSEGKRVIEIKPPLHVHKGEAVRTCVQRFSLRGVVFAGDDRTDLDAINELATLRADGLSTLAIVVKHIDTLPELLDRADEVVAEVSGMVQLLQDMVGSL
jgi:trehalose 6-phosphate phosphatase